MLRILQVVNIRRNRWSICLGVYTFNATPFFVQELNSLEYVQCGPRQPVDAAYTHVSIFSPQNTVKPLLRLWSLTKGDATANLVYV